MNLTGKSSTQRRTPLKNRPLRNPGQSVREARIDIVLDKLIPPLLAAFLLGFLAVYEWVRYFFPATHSPWLATVIAVVGLAYFGWQLVKYAPKVQALRLAEDGEKAVGQYLECLREQDYKVFHDVVGDGFNVDHVLIGPGGVFTVETKTWKKPAKGDAKIVFDGEQLTANGFSPDRNPVVQAKAQARWLSDLLAESTGKTFPVWPVLVFPGWFIENRGEAWREIWVLEPKALPKFLQNEATVLAADEVSMAAMHLGSFIRAQERVLDEKK